MSEALEAAIQHLRESNPDPAVVEALAAKTIKERNNPHTFQSIFTYDSFSRTTVICQLCGMQTVSTYREAGVHPATQHVAWHNQLHQAGIEAA